MTVLGGVRLLPGIGSARPVAGRRAGASRSRSNAVALPLARGATLPRPATLPRTTALPRTSARPVAAVPRRRLSRAERAFVRSTTVRALTGAVLVAFLIGLIYLAQTVNLQATNYDVDQLVAQRDDLYRQAQTIETTVLGWGTEPTVIGRAQQLGLDQLPSRIHIAAR